MKTHRFLLRTALATLAALAGSGCDPSPGDDVSAKVATLERQAQEAAARQRELEQQLAEQQQAAERDAIERERMEIEQARVEAAQLRDEAAAAQAETLRQRQAALAEREEKLERLQVELEDRQDDVGRRGEELSDRERELAGREALVEEKENAPAAAEDAAPTADYGMFHQSLSPYGLWIETPDYGFVWQPAIVGDHSWRPYTRGRWACTDRGWMWLSDEPFGWATYHYGRWALCRRLGWIWVPGSEWAPAWVCWRTGGSHIGWAPLPPETLAWRGHRWDASVETAFGIGGAWFSFVEMRHFGRPVHRHCLPHTGNDIYLRQTVNITHIHVHNRRVICGGPSYGDIARQSERRPPFYRIEEDRRGPVGPGPRHRIDGGRVRVAAPNVDAVWNEGLRPAKIHSRVDRVEIERPQSLAPEVADRFRQVREERLKQAGQAIQQRGGEGNFRVQRLEELAGNRRKTATATAAKPPPPATTDHGKAQARANEHAERLEKEMRRKDDRIRVLPKRVAPGTSPPTAAKPPPPATTDHGEAQARANEHAERLEEEMRRKDDRIRVLPKRVDPSAPSTGVVPLKPPLSPQPPANAGRDGRSPETRRQPAADQPDNRRVSPRRETPLPQPNSASGIDRSRRQNPVDIQPRVQARPQPPAPARPPQADASRRNPQRDPAPQPRFELPGGGMQRSAPRQPEVRQPEIRQQSQAPSRSPRGEEDRAWNGRR